jgi:flagellar biosynthesis protein FliR
MPAVEMLLQHVVPFLLVGFRLAGLFIFTPLLTNKLMPRQARAMLVVMLAAALYPTLPSHAQVAPEAGLVTLIPLVITETLIGAVIGFVASLPVLSLDMAGFLMSHQMGLGLGRVYNPDMGQDTDILGQLVMYLGLAAFLSCGGMEALFLSLGHSFRSVPAGAAAMDGTPLDLIVGVLGSGFELAMRVSAPVVCIIFLLMVALGFVGKTMPQINIMSVGFTIKIVFGLAMIAASLGAAQQAVSHEIERSIGAAMGWVTSLGVR